MKVTLEYFGQLRQAAGIASEQVEAPAATTAQGILKSVATKYGGVFKQVVIDEKGSIRPSLLVVLNDVPMDKEKLQALKDGDRIMLITAISGG